MEKRVLKSKKSSANVVVIKLNQRTCASSSSNHSEKDENTTTINAEDTSQPLRDEENQDQETGVQDVDQEPSTSTETEMVLGSTTGVEFNEIKSLDDLRSNFIEYQINVSNYAFEWSVSKSNRSVYVHYTGSSSNDVTGQLTVEINANLEVSVKVNGDIYLEADHPVTMSKTRPKNLKTLQQLLEFLTFLRGFKICTGNREPEFNKEIKNGFLNRYTGAVHADTCVNLHKMRFAERCKPCEAYRNNFQRNMKRAQTNVAIVKKSNLKEMKKNEEERVLKTHLKEKKQMMRQVARLKKKEARIVERLKKSDAEMLENYRGINLSKANFLKLLIKYHMKCDKIKLLKSLSANRWHPAIIKWCLNFYSLSASAYENLRNVIMLPASRTLSNYSSEFPTNHGFSPEVIYELRQKIDLDDMEEHHKYFALIVDEMQTTKTETGSDSEDEYEADVTRGSSRKSLPDSRIMVLMVQGLLTNFKHVLAYFPANNMTPEERQIVVFNGIKILENNGFKILTVICDDTPINLKFIKRSTKLDMEKGVYHRVINPFVPRNDHREIYFICDPPQLIKSVRDCLFNSGANKYLHLFQKNGKYIIWAHVREMYKKDNLARIRMCPKLTTNHIKLGPAYVRRVTMATQVLSNSVANAIDKLMGEDASETAMFIRYFNRFFDMLNTRKYAAGKTSRNQDLDPYTSLDDWRFEWLEDQFVGYLNDWKVEIKEADVSNDEKRRMIMSMNTLDPVIATVHSIVAVVKFLLSKGAPFVCTDKFNTDLLEHRYGKYWRADVNR